MPIFENQSPTGARVEHLEDGGAIIILAMPSQDAAQAVADRIVADSMASQQEEGKEARHE
jgi:hypothetical protein